MKFVFKWMPWLVVAVFALEIVAILIPKPEGELHTRSFGKLPVVMNGRVQPFDSVARNSLLQMRSTGDIPLELVPSWKFWHHPEKLRSTEWLLEVLFNPEQADTRHSFLVHHPELLSELNLQDKGIEKSGLRYYTFNDLRPHIEEIWNQGAVARKADQEKKATALQKQVIKLQNAIYLYQNLQVSVRPPMWENFRQDLAAFEKGIPQGVALMHARETGEPYDEEAYKRFWGQVTQLWSLAKDQNAGKFYPLAYPPASNGEPDEEWGNVGAGLLSSIRAREVYPPLKAFAAMADAYSREAPAQFNQALADYRQWLSARRFDRELQKGGLEFFYNQTKAFLHSMIMYICAFVLACGALLTLSAAPRLGEALRKSSLYLIVLAVLLHTFGLCFRMYLEGRPPVTNLYSSAVFIGWGAVVLGLMLERFFRVGLGNAVAAFSGFVTLIIAHNLAIETGDTMEMMRAVLDTNFWLATHVITITLGYSANFVAGGLAIAFILLGLFTKLLTFKTGKLDIGKALSKMTYAIICFATLFSFAGTVLGGIWADQSWGRFWGWDPKENGALIIVLWNAVLLHARWGRVVNDRGFMNMAIIGNIVTAWSWFGVNMLGVGLHSYGFMDAAFKWLMLFIVSQLGIILLGSIPLRLWRSFRPPEDDEAKPLPGAEAATA